MLTNVSSFLYPLALHLAAWKMSSHASILALLYPESLLAISCFSEHPKN